MIFKCSHCDFVSESRPDAVAHLRGNKDENGEFAHRVEIELGEGQFQNLAEQVTAKE